MSMDVFDSVLFLVEVIYLELFLVFKFYLKLSKKTYTIYFVLSKEYRIFFSSRYRILLSKVKTISSSRLVLLFFLNFP